MRILADYHHEELYESLLILFEDRFRWEVYRPTGEAWRGAGYWRLGHLPGGLQRMLEPPGQAPVGDHYEAPSVEHPDRCHKLVTYEQFRSRRWDFVLATVSDHEHLWQRLADEVGARAIQYVGNTGETVDWSLEHVVLAAARIDLRGPGVVYHPEFPTADYRYEPPEDPRRITNLVNHLPAFRSAYEDWLSLCATLPEFEFREHGLACRDGVVSRCSAVAATMRRAGWAFHDKPLGDGYGFAVHQWAAVGRPLIGRGRYYAGLLAEPFWCDGGTAIDLAAPAAAERIRAIAADPDRHRQMCEAVLTRFRQLVDFGAEAERIRTLLA